MKTPLNSETEEEEKDKKKQVVLVNVDGSTSIQNDDDNELESESESQITGNPIEASAYPQQYSQRSFQEEKKNDEEEIKEYSDCKGPLLENFDLNEDEKPNQMIVPENKDLQDNNNTVTNNDKLDFEFSMLFGEIHERITSLNSKLRDSALIWFHGTVNKKTGNVTYWNFGRLDQK